MTEAAYVELPILSWLCGDPEPGAPVGGLGWTYRDEEAMAAFDRPLEDPLVEKLLVAAILRINAEVKTEAQAKLAVAALRKTMSHPDKLTANRQTLDLLRDGARVVLNPGEDAKTVHFIAFDPSCQGPQRLHGDQSIPRAGCETVPRGYGAAGQWHSARRRRIQELSRQRQGLARGRAPASSLSAPGAADADAERILLLPPTKTSSVTAPFCSTTRAKTTLSSISTIGGGG